MEDKAALPELSFLLTIGAACYFGLPREGRFVEVHFPATAAFKRYGAPLSRRKGWFRKLEPGRRRRPRRPAAAAQSDDVETAVAFRRAVTMADYAKDDTFANDALQMKAFEQKQPPPEIVLKVDATPRPLPAELGFFGQVFGSRGVKRFYDQTVLVKSYPSMGARHGLEAYLVVPVDTPALQAAIYHFDPMDRGLRQVGEPCRNGRANELTVVISCLFERYQWRYRSGWVYSCILLDLGHLLATAAAAAKAARWRVEPVCDAPFRGCGPWIDLVNEPMLAFTLSKLS